MADKKYFVLMQNGKDTAQVFHSKQPRGAALKAASRGVTDIHLRERGTNRVHVLLDVEPGSEYSVHARVSSLPFVKDAQVLFGDHDMILKIEAETMGEIAKLVVDSIRSVEGVINTKTLACAEL